MNLPTWPMPLTGEQYYFNLLEPALRNAELRHGNPSKELRIIDRHMRTIARGNRNALGTHVELCMSDPANAGTVLQFVQSVIDYEYGDGPRPDPIYSTLFGDDAIPFK